MVRTAGIRFGDTFEKEMNESDADWINLITFGVGIFVGIGIVGIGLIPFTRKIENGWVLFGTSP